MDEYAKYLEVLGGRIREIRIEKGWTQEDLASEADIDRSYVGGVERGERNITFTMLCRVSAALECKISILTKELP
jgi:transcriptional regulator with XRE-family HTH domain